MSRKNKKAVADKIEESQPQVENKVDLVTFSEFFQESLRKGLVNSWQDKEIKTFFNDIGLTDKEPLDKYKDALAKY
jgi:hypothetical protein